MSHTGEPHSIRIDYQVLLADGHTEALTWHTETQALDALAAFSYALGMFWWELKGRSDLVKVWGMKVNIELTSDELRQSLEECSETSPPQYLLDALRTAATPVVSR